MTSRGRLVLLLGTASALGCQSLDRFDTKHGAAYCGSIVSSQFISTPDTEGGFRRDVRLRVQIDTDLLTTTPGFLTTDDAADGPCAPRATLANAPVRVTPEVVEDPLSTLMFEDGQVHNVVGWVDSTCRGTLFSVVSLYKNDRVEVRLLRPAGTTPTGAATRDAFDLFTLNRNDDGCGF